jgi:hypothetical protein
MVVLAAPQLNSIVLGFANLYSYPFQSTLRDRGRKKLNAHVDALTLCSQADASAQVFSQCISGFEAEARSAPFAFRHLRNQKSLRSLINFYRDERDFPASTVVPMGERSNFDPEDLFKIFEFLEIVEPDVQL